MLKTALESLLQRGLVRMTLGYLPGIRYQLSATGYNYAIDQGFILRIQNQQTDTSNS